MNVDVLVVGAGFAGSVMAERLARVFGKKVLLVEQRNHVGGNAFDAFDAHGVLIQKYGPHIFHTGSQAVWDYVNQWSPWNGYQHHVKGYIDGRIVPIPFNLDSLAALLPASLADTLERKLIARFGFACKVPILKLRQDDDPDLKFLGEFVYDRVFRHYTAKQWDTRLEDLTDEASGRVPVFVSRDDRYFQDPFQGLPSFGYHVLFEHMLDHPGIRILLNTDYKDVIDEIAFRKLVFTGPIDRFFDYRFGHLPFRSIRFQWEHLDCDYFQSNSVVNYPNDDAFTRITEYKRLTGQRCPGTTISREFPCWAEPEKDIPYYPMPDSVNLETYGRYQALAAKLADAIFIGRLAQYRYFDMDDIVAEALARADELGRSTW
jgi:UDP-galactopyranose mutase